MINNLRKGCKISISNIVAGVITTLFAVWGFMLSILALYRIKHGKHGDVKYEDNQLKYRYSDLHWSCLDPRYKNLEQQESFNRVIPDMLNDVKVLKCRLDGKHNYTVFDGMYNDETFIFSCPNCKDKEMKKVDKLSIHQKAVIEMQFPGVIKEREERLKK